MILSTTDATSHKTVVSDTPSSTNGTEFYTSRACKGSALLADTRALLRAWNPGDTAEVLEHRALSQDILGKATAQRVHDVVRRVFAPRYLGRPSSPQQTQPDPFARYLKRLLEANPPGDWFRDLCLIYAARTDVVLRDVLVVHYPQALAEGRTRLNKDSIHEFLRQAELNGRMKTPWSDTVRRRVAAGLSRQLTEFGLLSNPHPTGRDLLRFRPCKRAIAFLAHEIHFSGASDAGLMEHPDWRLWQLDREALRQELDELSRDGLWIFQAAGSVVRIAWTYSTMQEAVDAIARFDLH